MNLNLRTKNRLLAMTAAGAAIIALAGLAVGLSLGLRSAHGNASGSVNLSVGNKGIVATGDLATILSKASSMAGITVEVPENLPTGSYVNAVVVVPGPNGTGVTTGPAAEVYITVPSGQYIVDELKGTIGGLAGATEASSLESPGKTVFIAPGSGGAGYAVVGKHRSFMLTPGSPQSAASAKVDFPKMVASLTVD